MNEETTAHAGSPYLQDDTCTYLNQIKLPLKYFEFVCNFNNSASKENVTQIKYYFKQLIICDYQISGQHFYALLMTLHRSSQVSRDAL